MKHIYYFSLILLILLVSCALSENRKAYINKVSQLEQSLDSVSRQYFAIDTIQLFEAYDLINSNLSRFGSIDTVVNDSVKLYAAMQKSFKRVINDHPRIIQEFHFSNKQLKNLKSDIRKGKMTDKEMENYYFEEMEAVGILLSRMQYNAQIIELQLHSFEPLNEYVEMIITRFDNR